MNPAEWLRKILLLSLLFHISFSDDTIKLDHFLKDNGDVIVSRGKNFALGFFSPGSSRNRYVGIWYYQIPGKIVVWVANRNNPIKDNSGILSIDSGGNLALFQRNQTLPVWSTDISMAGTRNSVAQILDSGNLVLLQNDARKAVLWQSFDYPTNTWLSFIKLGLNKRTGLNRVFTSWKSPDDPGFGNYSLKMNTSGFPQMILYRGSTPWWRSGPWTGQRWSGIPEMTNHFILDDYFVDSGDEVTFTSVVKNDSIISRTVTNETGILQGFIWNKEAQRWILFYSTPKEQCDFYGHCGPNEKSKNKKSKSYFSPVKEKQNSAADYDLSRHGDPQSEPVMNPATTYMASHNAPHFLTCTRNSIAQVLESSNLVLLHNGTRKAVLWQSFDYPTNSWLSLMSLGLKVRTGLNHVSTSWKSPDDPVVGDHSFEVSPTGFRQMFCARVRLLCGEAGHGPGMANGSIIVYQLVFLNSRLGFTNSSYPQQVPHLRTHLLMSDQQLPPPNKYIIPDQSHTEPVMNPATSLFSILLFFFLSLFSLSANTITQHYFIKDNDELVSSGKTFALGFFSPGSSRYRYVGIWYYQIPGKIVVWVANRDNPIKDNSGILSIDSRGNLALFQRNQTLPVWSTNISITGTRNSIAQILDSGNLVLLQDDARKAVLWQSFDYPTNTWLSFQSLGVNVRTGLNREYTSWKSPDDPGVGNYSFRMNRSGFPQMFLYQGSTPSWRSGTWSGQSWIGIPEMTKNVLFNDTFVNTNDEVSFSSDVRNASIITRAVMNETGIFQRLIWNNETQRWIEFYSIPKERCDFYGLCGPNAYYLVDARTYTNMGQDLYIRVDKNELDTYLRLQSCGFGPVYKGVLSNRSEIAHRNLVRMLGYCIEGEEKMLIYEFLPNKSLDSIIFDESKRSLLDWKKRLEIICGIARGMLIFGGDQTEGDTKRVVGTYGYMSPEYAMHGHFSMKSDVYSFGVLLLEIITGKKNSSYFPDSPSLNLVGHVWELWKEDKTMELKTSDF
ncbi:hypothetical protein V6N12_034395 [Hibiscus sabdariffa]|uniref:Uncharacterized protein n=1 Tax=Hibiscus sabdariffa TaxID=183260 RepID=A0ABR2AK75_9ROSI